MKRNFPQRIKFLPSVGSPDLTIAASHLAPILAKMSIKQRVKLFDKEVLDKFESGDKLA